MKPRLGDKMVKSDWEGPWVTADYAYEIAKRGIPNGNKLFAGISEYDDYLAYIRKKEGYEPGDTLALIAPFLIAYDIDEKFLVNVAKDNANFIRGSLDAIKMLSQLGYTLEVISTSYCQYVHYTTKIVGIPRRNTRCTYFPIDEYYKIVKEKDKKLVRGKVKDIINLPRLGITASTVEGNLHPKALESIKKLDDFFWKELLETGYKYVLDEVKPIGGYRKFNALKEVLEEEGRELCESETIGDSITDWIMLKETRDAGGLAISFNGNEYAVKNANVAIVSDNCMITPIIVDLFRRSGIEGVEKITSNWNQRSLKDAVRKNWLNSVLFKKYIESIGKATSTTLPVAIWITENNLEATIRKSKEVRKAVRGVAVGSLG